MCCVRVLVSCMRAFVLMDVTYKMKKLSGFKEKLFNEEVLRSASTCAKVARKGFEVLRSASTCANDASKCFCRVSREAPVQMLDVRCSFPFLSHSGSNAHRIINRLYSSGVLIWGLVCLPSTSVTSRPRFTSLLYPFS